MVHKAFVFRALLALSSTSFAQVPQRPKVATTLASECIQKIETDCIPTASDCAAAICYLCTSLGISPSIEPCCASATPEACFATNYVNGQTGPITPVSPTSEPIPSFLATLPVASETSLTSLSSSCQSQAGVYKSCKVKTPEFDNLSFSDLQSCLCTIDGKAAPSVYDDYFSGCLMYASVFYPDEYAILPPSGATGFSGMVDSRTLLGSRPCESWAQITSTRTGATTPVISTATGSIVTHGGAVGVGLKVSGDNPELDVSKRACLLLI